MSSPGCSPGDVGAGGPSTSATTRERGGWFTRRKHDADQITVESWENPWTFQSLFCQPGTIWVKWLIDEGFLGNEHQVQCHGKVGGTKENPVYCKRPCYLVARDSKIDGMVWRCTENSKHETTVRINSFFSLMKHTIPDVMMFIKNFLDGHLLRKCAKFSKISYGSTAGNWASYIRDCLIQYVWRQVIDEPLQLRGVIEIDESLFRHKQKYHRGKPVNSKVNVWVVGLVERATGRIILYPVENRNKETLLTIIRRHVVPGSTIYTDGWMGYNTLNQEGYHHFTVIHKDTFKARYKNVETGEVIYVDTNMIEGGWQHAKGHFARIHGTSIGNFEGHLSEIIWRNHHRGSPGRVYRHFFNLLKDIYDHKGEAHLTAPRPLFDTWRADLKEGESVKIHSMYQGQDQPDLPAADLEERIGHDHSYASPSSQDSSSSALQTPLSGPLAIPETPPSQQAGPAPKSPVEPRRRVPQDRHVCMPSGFVPVASASGGRKQGKRSGGHGGKRKHGKGKKKRLPKKKAPPVRSHCYPDMSSDSDFV